jgi:uncharacterized protein YfdQ (DUF2303 family)
MDNETNNLPMNALEAGIAAATLANPTIDHDDGRRHALIPEGYQMLDISDPDRSPAHIKRHVTVDDRASLVGYANRFSDHRSIIIGDYDAGKITAHLDWHADNHHELKPEHVAHSVTLEMRDSEEYARWNKMEGKLHPQDEFALFIEENVTDVASPDHSDLLEICRELEATQGTRFKSGIRLDNGDRSFTYENETHVKSEISVPREIHLEIPLYFGEEPQLITAKFRFRPTAEGLLLGFNWHRVEYRRQATFREMAFKAAEETGLPVFQGRA